MIKITCYSFFLFLGSMVFAQIEFYGSAEAIDPVNSTSGENYLTLGRDGKSIFFTREKHPQNAGGRQDRGDLWVSTLDSGWTSPVSLPTNDSHFASPLDMTPDGGYFLYNKVWFDKGIYYGGVFAYKPDDPTKEIQVDIPFFKNRSPIQTGHLSVDGQHLLLSLENSAGYGVDDLFVSFLQKDGSWTLPRNLGHLVNTRFQEVTPFLAADNKTLFFASNGRGGAGSFDIYMTIRQDDTWQNWSDPVGLGSSVNTSGAETSFAFNQGAEFAYFVSTQNSDGYGDIKRIRIKATIEEAIVEEQVAPVVSSDSAVHSDVRVVDFLFKNARSQDTIFATVIKKEIGVLGEATASILADTTTGFLARIQPEEVWELEFKAKGYLSEEIVIGWEELDSIESRVIELEPLESGNTITLKNVLFYRGTANFIEGSQRELDLVVEMLKENPEINIFLKGHTDNVGSPVLNAQLSQERVQSVKEYLVNEGISLSRISGKGFGGSEPVASNETEETRKLNRRVEFEIRRD